MRRWGDLEQVIEERDLSGAILLQGETGSLTGHVRIVERPADALLGRLPVVILGPGGLQGEQGEEEDHQVADDAHGVSRAPYW